MARYNRYIPSGTTYTRILEDDRVSPQPVSSPSPQLDPPAEESAAPSHSGHSKGLSGILKYLKLDKLDSGDILLLLILLFLFLEGDDIELMITLGLLLLLGLE